MGDTLDEKIERVLGTATWGPGYEVVRHTRWVPAIDAEEVCVSYCPRCELARRMRAEFGDAG